MTKRLAILFSLVLLSCLPDLPCAYGTDRFVDNGDGTVTDHQLKLMWSRTDNQGDIDWHQAGQWVKYTFSIALPQSHDNWRLPTLKELESLVDTNAERETDCGLKSHIVPPIHLSCGWIWTAESDPIAPTARVFNFDNIYHYTVRKAHRRGYRALAVRNLN